MSNLSITKIPSRMTSAIASALPEKSFDNKKINKRIAWIGKRISSPENRLILGVSALMTQPFIDLSNKKIDEDTRKVSAARTVAKIIAGTLTGVLVRAGCIKLIDYMTLIPAKMEKTIKNPQLRSLFTPEAALTGMLKDLGHYKKAWGTILSLLVMLVTNFAIDAPLTKYLTNKFVDKIHQKDSAAKAEEVKHE